MEETGADIKIYDEFFAGKPTLWESKPGIDLNDDYINNTKASGHDSFETMLEYVTRLTAELLWFKFLSEGAEKLKLLK